MERICFLRSKFFPLRVGSFSEKMKKCKIASAESVSAHFKYNQCTFFSGFTSRKRQKGTRTLGNAEVCE